eukprot:gene14727-17402_t
MTVYRFCSAFVCAENLQESNIRRGGFDARFDARRFFDGGTATANRGVKEFLILRQHVKPFCPVGRGNNAIDPKNLIYGRQRSRVIVGRGSPDSEASKVPEGDHYYGVMLPDARFLEEEKNLTSEQLNTAVWPFYTYGSFASLLFVGCAVETMGYKPVILFGLLCRESTRLLLLFGSSLPLMSLMQMTYASASAVNAVYFAYAYCVMDPRYFQQATACMHASFHIGNIFGSVLGQLRGMYAHAIILLWSLWWLMGFGASNIITNYYQTQFYDIESDGDFGTVEALIELFSALGEGPDPMHLFRMVQIKAYT